MKVDPKHKSRIYKELRKAGLIGYSLLSMETRYLPSIIHQDEHIEAVVYGFYKDGTAMLVATNLRIMFLDRKPLYTIMDELTYEMVAGVAISNQLLFASVTLHTRVKDFVINYVKPSVANKFAHYIEYRRVENPDGDGTVPAPPKTKPYAHKNNDTNEEGSASTLALYSPMTQAAQDFLRDHRLGTLSSVDRGGNVHGAAVYYTQIGDSEDIYVLTKSETQKVHNILANSKVALTVYDEKTLQTLQLQATAKVETNVDIKSEVFGKIMTPRWFNNERRLPPVADITEGSYIVINIKPTGARFSDYSLLHRT